MYYIHNIILFFLKKTKNEREKWKKNRKRGKKKSKEVWELFTNG
jgi:hypothetical protein